MGERTTSATLYSVTPMRPRIWCCQYCPSAKKTASRTPPPIRLLRQVAGLGGRTSRSAKARTMTASTTPRPYPMAAVTPQTIPWITPVRGSSDGVNDRHEKTTAPQKPGTVRLCHCPRRRVSGSGSGTVASRPACARVCAGTATPVAPGSTLSDMLGLLCRCALGAASAAEGLHQDLALLVGEVRADELRVHPVQPLAEPVEVRVLRDDEQRGGPRGDLLAD